MTTALMMCAVVMAVGADNPRFVAVSCINIVVAANAGGAFSPFGDITTLMVWQKGWSEFLASFCAVLPSLVNWLVPAAIMHFAIPKRRTGTGNGGDHVKAGANDCCALRVHGRPHGGDL